MSRNFPRKRSVLGSLFRLGVSDTQRSLSGSLSWTGIVVDRGRETIWRQPAPEMLAGPFQESSALDQQPNVSYPAVLLAIVAWSTLCSFFSWGLTQGSCNDFLCGERAPHAGLSQFVYARACRCSLIQMYMYVYMYACTIGNDIYSEWLPRSPNLDLAILMNCWDLVRICKALPPLAFHLRKRCLLRPNLENCNHKWPKLNLAFWLLQFLVLWAGQMPQSLSAENPPLEMACFCF